MQMKWYERFLQKISDYVPSRPSLATVEALSRLNPDHIEVENVRSVLNISHSAARRICETAVRRGLFVPKTAIVCPDDSIAKVLGARDSMPQTVKCWNEGEPLDIATSELEKREFYVLNER